jgi:hypothetical protein
VPFWVLVMQKIPDTKRGQETRPRFFCPRTGEEGGDRFVGTASPTQPGGEVLRLTRDSARPHSGERTGALKPCRNAVPIVV